LIPADNSPQPLTPPCFLTDNRGFSSAEGATARLDTHFQIAPDAGNWKVLPASGRTAAGTTVKIDCKTGAQADSAQGLIERDHLGAPSVADGKVQVIGQVQGKNQLAGVLAPSIDYSLDIIWSPWKGELKADITYGSFPATEVYARVAGREWKAVLRRLPNGPPWKLAGDSFGINTVRETQTLTLPTVEGLWRSQDQDQRFRLQMTSGQINLIERAKDGRTLSRQVAVSQLPDGSMRISRPNDSEVLEFIGYQSSLRAEILARSPQPSYVILRFDGTGLRGEWYGLLVIKDEHAKLKEIFQPGTRQPGIYSFAH